MQIITMVHMHWFEEANETPQLQSSMATQSLSHSVADQVRPVYPCDILILTYYVIMLSSMGCGWTHRGLWQDINM
jgi:hypothetical protein